LLVGDSLLEFFNLVAQAPRLPLSDLLEMLFGLNFFVFGVYQTLSVNKLHLNGLEMFLQNFKALLMLLDLQTKLGNKSDLLSDDLVQFLVLVVGIWGEFFVQVVLGNRVNNVVCHFSSLIVFRKLIKL